MRFDTVITNVRVVTGDSPDPINADIGITDGVISEVNPGLNLTEANEVIDAKGRIAFPGLLTPTSIGESITN